MSLDPATRQRITRFIERSRSSRLTPKQVTVQFRLRPDDEAEVRDLMLVAALAPSGPEVLTPPAEVLDRLVLEVAAALSGARMLLVRCRFCRNHLLYLLDTAPYENDPGSQIISRLRALPQVHELSHQNQAAVNHGDSRPPQIRWISGRPEAGEMA